MINVRIPKWLLVDPYSVRDFEKFENPRRNDTVNLIISLCKVEWRFEVSIFIDIS